MNAGIDFFIAGIVAVFCLVLAAAGTWLAGDGLRSWYPGLIKPRLQIPLWLFAAVGGVVYILDGIVLYRLLTEVDDAGGRVVAVTALAVVMIYNEAWNYAFLGRKSTYTGWITLLAFLAPLTILQVALIVFDPISAAIMGVYILWVLAYDLAWMRSLWRLNR